MCSGKGKVRTTGFNPFRAKAAASHNESSQQFHRHDTRSAVQESQSERAGHQLPEAPCLPSAGTTSSLVRAILERQPSQLSEAAPFARSSLRTAHPQPPGHLVAQDEHSCTHGMDAAR